MRTSPLSLGIALGLAIPLGCAETPGPVAPTPTATVAVAQNPPPAAGDLSPVAEPADIVGLLRWKNPGATLNGVTGCAGVPQQLGETNARLALSTGFGEAFEGVADAKQLSQVMSLDAPFDVVVALDPAARKFQGMVAFSIGLTSLERGKAAIEAVSPLTETSPGVWSFGGNKRRDLHCVIASSAGSTPARLVCGGREQDLQALGPYLARTVPTLPAPRADIHAELRYKPIDARFGSDIRRLLGFLPTGAQAYTINEPRFDRALVDAANALVEEGNALASDLDKVTLDVSVDPTNCVTASGALEMRGAASWLTGTLTERPDRSGPPPAIFLRAPKDADVAYYTRGTDPARYAGILRALRGLAEGAMAKNKIGSEADQKAVGDLIKMRLGKDTNTVFASGHIDAPQLKLAAGAEPTEQQIIDTVMNGYVGWHLIGFDEGPEAPSKVLKDLVALYGRKGLIDPLKKKMGHRDAAMLPTVKMVAAPPKLGRGALDAELKFEVPSKKKADSAKAKKDEKVTFSIHILLMADGKNTWLGVGANRDELVKRLLAAKSDAPASGQIATRAGLEPLRSGKAAGSGFASLSVLTKPLASALAMPALGNLGGPLVGDAAAALKNMPHKGETPIFFDRQVKGGDAPRAELNFTMAKGSFEDLGSLVMAALRIATNAGLIKPQTP